MIREVRTTNKVPPREKVEVSAKLPADLVAVLRREEAAFGSLANVTLIDAGPDCAKPDNAATVVRPLGEIYLHRQFDAAAECDRLTKQLESTRANAMALDKRLNNPGYAQKAPPHLVEETRNKLSQAHAEIEKLEAELKALG
jgi:valyl-tRNA synthetase